MDNDSNRTPNERNTNQTYTIAEDVLYGASEIATFLGFSRRSVYHFIENGELPVFRVGSKLCARKSTLIQHIAALEENQRGSVRSNFATMLDLKPRGVRI